MVVLDYQLSVKIEAISQLSINYAGSHLTPSSHVFLCHSYSGTIKVYNQADLLYFNITLSLLFCLLTCLFFSGLTEERIFACKIQDFSRLFLNHYFLSPNSRLRVK